jgi:hypothetical protein
LSFLANPPPLQYHVSRVVLHSHSAEVCKSLSSAALIIGEPKREVLMKCRVNLVVAVLAVGLGLGSLRAEDGRKEVTAPAVTGAWTGIWGPYSPAPGAGLAKDKCKRLDCQVVRKAGVWQATFEGECGRPYKYTIKMEGRQAGNVVLFKGTVDLGEKDGGVYDWVGRATDKEFIGFYTSAHYTGAFQLSRAK